jgi:predicted DCC family thiol-disulfide oxidoreductase YuxK
MTTRQRRAPGDSVVGASTTGPNGTSESGTLVYDGDCGFCTTSAGWARRIAPELVTIPWQFAELDKLGITEAAAAAEVQYVDARGTATAGAQAIASLLVSVGGLLGLMGRVMRLPGIRALAAVVYKLVAANRHRLPGGTPACRLAATEKDS